MRLNVKAMAVTFGLVWGLGLFCMTWWIMYFDGTGIDSSCISMVYRGYEISPTGSLIGLAWGLLDGAIGGAIIAAVYNCISGKLESNK